MKLLGKGVVEKFKKKHAQSRKALDRWIKLMESNDYSSPQELRTIFGNSVDIVGRQTVFDVGGNKVRTITKIQYDIKIVFVTHVLTHAQYDKEKWKD